MSRPSIEEVRAALTYDPKTGLFVWAIKPSKIINQGDRAGYETGGYVHIQFKGKKFGAHRLAWAIQTGKWPENEIDHIDGNGMNNAFSNLRQVTRSENMQNQRRARSDNATGLLGAQKHGNAFTATIIINGRRHHLGRFKTAELAHQAYIQAKRDMHTHCTI